VLKDTKSCIPINQ